MDSILSDDIKKIIVDILEDEDNFNKGINKSMNIPEIDEIETIKNEILTYACEIINERYGGVGLEDAISNWARYKDEVLYKV